MAAVSTLGPYGCPRAPGGNFAGKIGIGAKWTLMLEIDSSWIGNTNSLIRVTGYLATQNVPTVPGLPSGTQ